MHEVIEPIGPATHQPLAVTVADAARMLSVSRTTIYELIGGGRLQARKLGSRTLILVASMQQLLDELPPAAAA